MKWNTIREPSSFHCFFRESWRSILLGYISSR